MNCIEIRRHLMPYRDGECGPDLHLRIEDHLAMCPECARCSARQGEWEARVEGRISAGDRSPDLWGRVLAGAGLRKPQGRRSRWPTIVGGLAAAILLTLFVGHRATRNPQPPGLTRSVAEWHEQWRRGNVRPDLVSTSDREVDHYLKSKVPFRVHCPPRTDVDFSVEGAGVCFMKDGRQAAYIVGHVAQAPVSILVLDRGRTDSAPQDGFQHGREGTYRVATGVIADNVVVVIGAASADVLERLLNAYGSYHEG